MWWHHMVLLVPRAVCSFSAAAGKLQGQSVNAAQPTGTSHLLRLFDKNTGQYFWLIQGLRSVPFPASRSHRLNKIDFTIRAANNSTINTYGYKQLTLNLGLSSPLTWRFISADVGADFLLQHKLLADLDKQCLIDTFYQQSSCPSWCDPPYIHRRSPCFGNSTPFVTRETSLR